MKKYLHLLLVAFAFTSCLKERELPDTPRIVDYSGIDLSGDTPSQNLNKIIVNGGSSFSQKTFNYDYTGSPVLVAAGSNTYSFVIFAENAGQGIRFVSSFNLPSEIRTNTTYRASVFQYMEYEVSLNNFYSALLDVTDLNEIELEFDKISPNELIGVFTIRYPDFDNGPQEHTCSFHFKTDSGDVLVEL